MKMYENPEMEIIRFRIADIVTVSNMLPVAPIAGIADVSDITAEEE